MSNTLFEELQQRGFINQSSDMDAVRNLLDNGKIVAYLGSDPTGDSLHVGHLVPVMMMRWLQKYGHKPIALVGGATGRIGDPSGRDSGRPIMTEETLAKNIAGLKKSFSKFLKFDGTDNDALMVDNYDWMRGYSHLDFLAQYGLDFTIPRMLSMESVKKRLENGSSQRQLYTAAINAIFGKSAMLSINNTTDDILMTTDYKSILQAYPEFLDASRYSLILTGNFTEDNILCYHYVTYSADNYDPSADYVLKTIKDF